MATIKSSGGDYTTVALWEADTDNDLTGAGEVIGEIYDVNPTSAIDIAGATNTSASNFRHLTVNSAYRHAGKLDTGKANIQVSSIPSFVDLSENYARVSYWQAINTRNPGEGVFGLNATGVQAISCIGKHNSPSTGDGAAGFAFKASGASALAINCISINNRNGFWAASGSTGQALNCTSIINSLYGFRSASATALVLTNCYTASNTSSAAAQASDTSCPAWTITTCGEDGASGTTGFTGSIAYSTANFTNVTSGSEDLTLVTGSALIDVGTDLSGTFTTDIIGTTRSGTWDMGPFEFVAAGGGDARPKRLLLLGVG